MQIASARGICPQSFTRKALGQQLILFEPEWTTDSAHIRILSPGVLFSKRPGSFCGRIQQAEVLGVLEIARIAKSAASLVAGNNLPDVGGYYKAKIE
ncbi:MAG TPA: hypothetical protein DCZ69_04045 [Syntrophobacteraceae bacterium]|nr:hypothetical protein [Syntrophobacteraceae bacterium]